MSSTAPTPNRFRPILIPGRWSVTVTDTKTMGEAPLFKADGIISPRMALTEALLWFDAQPTRTKYANEYVRPFPPSLGVADFARDRGMLLGALEALNNDRENPLTLTIGPRINWRLVLTAEPAPSPLHTDPAA